MLFQFCYFIKKQKNLCLYFITYIYILYCWRINNFVYNSHKITVLFLNNLSGTLFSNNANDCDNDQYLWKLNTGFWCGSRWNETRYRKRYYKSFSTRVFILRIFFIFKILYFHFIFNYSHSSKYIRRIINLDAYFF